MNSPLKNITAILVILTIAFLGYYLFLQKDNSDLSLAGGGVAEDLFVDVQKYAERRQLLDRVQLKFDIFADARFRSLKGYPTDIEEVPIGRQNPFDEITITR